MKAIIVCVDYWDYLKVTLPWNKEHFSRIVVVTSHEDRRTQQVVKAIGSAECWVTNAFYRDGHPFNKGRAIEEAFDVLGREGWFCQLDADVLIPKDADLNDGVEIGRLYLAKRRLGPELDQWHEHTDWSKWPEIDQRLYQSGCLQVFHSDDVVLARRPWYPCHWKHAGGSDIEFIEKWPIWHRRYYTWDVLHLGPVRENWWGRHTPFPNGALPAGAKWSRHRMAKMDADRMCCGYAKELDASIVPCGCATVTGSTTTEPPEYASPSSMQATQEPEENE